MSAFSPQTTHFDAFPLTVEAGSPVVVPTQPRETNAAGLLHNQRLTAVLRGVVEGFGVASAEFCMLDDATAELRVAADYGDETPAPTRPLESARADLAALAGGAVVLEDADGVAEWGVTQRCRAAVCVPVASDTTIHGTLWLYSATPRGFSDSEFQLIEIAAGRLAVEVERRRLLDARTTLPPVATPPVCLPQPTAATQLGELEVGGWASETTPAVCDWTPLADGRLLLLAAAVVDTPGGTDEEAMLAVQAARMAARCHAEALAGADRLDAGRLLTQVSHSVWQATPGGEGVSMALALVDPDECAGAYAIAGGGVSLSVRASQARAELTESAPAGWDRDERYESHPFELTLRERLVLAVVDPQQATPTRVEKLADRYRGLAPETHRQMTATDAANALRDLRSAPQAAVAVRWK